MTSYLCNNTSPQAETTLIPLPCPKHMKYGAPFSSCNDCGEYSLEIDTGICVPTVEVEFDETIWSHSSKASLEDDLVAVSPCEKLAAVPPSPVPSSPATTEEIRAAADHFLGDLAAQLWPLESKEIYGFGGEIFPAQTQSFGLTKKQTPRLQVIIPQVANPVPPSFRYIPAESIGRSQLRSVIHENECPVKPIHECLCPDCTKPDFGPLPAFVRVPLSPEYLHMRSSPFTDEEYHPCESSPCKDTPSQYSDFSLSKQSFDYQQAEPAFNFNRVTFKLPSQPHQQWLDSSVVRTPYPEAANPNSSFAQYSEYRFSTEGRPGLSFNSSLGSYIGDSSRLKRAFDRFEELADEASDHERKRRRSDWEDDILADYSDDREEGECSDDDDVWAPITKTFYAPVQEFPLSIDVEKANSYRVYETYDEISVEMDTSD